MAVFWCMISYGIWQCISAITLVGCLLIFPCGYEGYPWTDRSRYTSLHQSTSLYSTALSSTALLYTGRYSGCYSSHYSAQDQISWECRSILSHVHRGLYALQSMGYFLWHHTLGLPCISHPFQLWLCNCHCMSWKLRNSASCSWNLSDQQKFRSTANGNEIGKWRNPEKCHPQNAPEPFCASILTICAKCH